jgi:hypothetical protein
VQASGVFAGAGALCTKINGCHGVSDLLGCLLPAPEHTASKEMVVLVASEWWLYRL